MFICICMYVCLQQLGFKFECMIFSIIDKWFWHLRRATAPGKSCQQRLQQWTQLIHWRRRRCWWVNYVYMYKCVCVCFFLLASLVILHKNKTITKQNKTQRWHQHFQYPLLSFIHAHTRRILMLMIIVKSAQQKKKLHERCQSWRQP